MALRELADRYGLEDLHWACQKLAVDILLPVMVGIMCLAISFNFLKTVGRWIFPPPLHTQHKEAIDLYRGRKIREALKALELLQRKRAYGPAVLSLAAHEIYVVGAPGEGLRLLREARKMGLAVPKGPMDTMQEDAKAILDGNSVMVEMNARLAKQEYLGLPTL